MAWCGAILTQPYRTMKNAVHRLVDRVLDVPHTQLLTNFGNDASNDDRLMHNQSLLGRCLQLF